MSLYYQIPIIFHSNKLIVFISYVLNFKLFLGKMGLELAFFFFFLTVNLKESQKKEAR